MAIAHVAFFGSAQSKTAGTSLNINPADANVSVGDDVFVSFSSDDVGSAHSVTDGGTASITWTLETSTLNTGNVRNYLFRGAVTAAGTLTDITISWTTNITAKAAVAGIFSGVGTRDGTSTDQNESTTVVDQVQQSDISWQSGDLVIGGDGYEGPNGDTHTISDNNGTSLPSPTKEGQDGTTGGGAASNITCVLGWSIANATAGTGESLRDTGNNARPNAAAGAVYSPASGDHPLTVDPGSYSITGVAATLVAGYVVSASPGSYVITGVDAVLVVGRVVSADPGIYAVTGFLVEFAAPLRIDADPGVFAVTGAAATLVVDRLLIVDPGVYVLTGADTVLVYTPGGAVLYTRCLLGVGI